MFANKGKNPFLLCMYFVYCDAEAEIYKWLRGLTKTSLDNCFKKVIRKVLDWKVSKQTVTYTKYVGKKLEILNKQLHTSISSLFLLYKFYTLDELRRPCISIYKGGIFLFVVMKNTFWFAVRPWGCCQQKHSWQLLFAGYSPAISVQHYWWQRRKIKSRLNSESKNATKTVDSNSRSEFFSWMSFVFFFFLGGGSGNFSCCHKYLINWFYCSNFSLKNYSVFPWVYSLVL